MADAEHINNELMLHAQKIERARREKWALQPMPIDEFAFNLRMRELGLQINEWFERQRKHG